MSSQSGVQFTIQGTGHRDRRAVRRVQVEIQDRNTKQYLQDDLVSWGGTNNVNASLATPNAASTAWSLPVTITGNRELQLMAKTFAVNGTSDATKAIKKIESFSIDDQTPTTGISGPSGSVLTSTTFIATGTANDDKGVNALTYWFRDDNNRYLQDDGTVSSNFNTFRGTPDVVGATSATWQYEVTLPYEGTWRMSATAIDNSGQSDLERRDRDWLISSTGVAPSVAITSPAPMTPPTAAPAYTVTPGGRLTFSGTATDAEDLQNVEISLRNNTTREQLASDGTWGTDVIGGWYRISPANLNNTSYNWTYTTPFNLTPGKYSFSVRATDDLGLTTSSTNQGRLTINAQVAGDLFPNGRLNFTGTDSSIEVLHLDLAGTATDDIGVASVRVALEDQDTGRYVQPNGTMAAAFATIPATLASPNATSTTWTLGVNLPTKGEYAVTAFAVDTSGQQDTSTSGATASYPVYPGDLDPTISDTLFSPTEGTAFTDARIFVSGRVEDDTAMGSVQVAVVNSAGQYMSSSGTLHQHHRELADGLPEQPGHARVELLVHHAGDPVGGLHGAGAGVDAYGQVHPVPRDSARDGVGPGRQRRPDGQLHGLLQPERLRLRRPHLDRRERADADLLVELRQRPHRVGLGAEPHLHRASTYTVTLTVRDEYGLTGTTTQTVTITEPAGNVAPTPVINPPSCTGLVCNFCGVGSADPNTGDTFTYLWNFGDGTADQHLVGPVAHVPGGRHLHGDPHRHRRLGQGGQHHPAGDRHRDLGGEIVQTEAVRCGGRLGSGVHAQFGQDVGDVDAGRLAADEQGLGDLAVGAAGGHQAEHLQLAGGEAGGGGAGLAGRFDAEVEPAPAAEGLQRGQERSGAQPLGDLVGRPGRLGRLLAAALAEQRLGQAPAAPGLLVQVAVAEGVGRGRPAGRVGPALDPGPLGLGPGQPGHRLGADLAPAVPGPLERRPGPLQHVLADRLALLDGRLVAGGPGPLGQVALGGQGQGGRPDGAQHPGDAGLLLSRPGSRGRARWSRSSSPCQRARSASQPPAR